MKFIILPFILLITTTLFAQTGTINGTVKTTDGQATPFVSVQLSKTQIGTQTNEKGEFSLKNVPTNEYVLMVSGIGYENYRQSLKLTEGQTLNVNIQIIPQITQLQDVEVTGRRETSYKSDYSFSATKTATPVKDIPQTISTITKEMITDQQSYRLQDVVKNVSGANQFSVYDDITIRGFRSSENRLMNGLRFSGNFWTSPLLVNIERVEVIKGPASAMFGNTNPGGTINMVTKKPLEETRGSVQITAGNFKTTRTTADFTGAVNEEKTVLYRLNMGYENSGSFRDMVNFRTLAIAPSISYVPNEKTRINFDLNYQDINTILDRGRTVFQGEQNLTATPVNFNLSQPGDFLRPRQFSASLSWTQKLSEKLNLNVAFMRFREDQTLQEHGFNGYITRDSIQLYYTDRIVNYMNDNINAYLTYRANTGQVAHTLLFGYDFSNLDYKYTEKYADDVLTMSLRKPEYYPRDVSKYTYQYSPLGLYDDAYSTSGFYVQDQIKYNQWQLLLSLRHERYNIPPSSSSNQTGADLPTNATLPRIGLVYSLNKNINLYATYNQGFSVPDPYSVPFIVGGDPKPVTGLLYEAGAKTEWFDKRLLATFSLYHLAQNNVITSANDPNKADALVQRGQEVARGAELEVVGNVNSNLSVMFAYAYNKATITKDADEKLVGLSKENAPLHNSSSWIKYVFSGKLNGLGISIGHSHNSQRNGFRDSRYVAVILPSYVVFNALAYYQVDKMRVSLNVNNITNKTWFAGGYNFQRNFPGSPRQVLVSVGYRF